MANLQLEDFHYMAEDLIDDMDEDDYGRAGGDMEAHEYDMLTRVTDTSSCQARNGKDIQGIPWERLNITREDYRLTRLEQYKNYENIPASGEAIDKECKLMEKGGNYYEFFHNTRLVKPTILHFQFGEMIFESDNYYFELEGLVSFGLSNSGLDLAWCLYWALVLVGIVLFEFCAISSYVTRGIFHDNRKKRHSDCLSEREREVVRVGGTVVDLWSGSHLDRKGVAFCTRTAYDDKAITNTIEIYDGLRGGINFMASNNDCSMREYDTERFQLLNNFRFPWPVNHTSVSPDRRLITVVGDNLDGLLVDLQNGKTVATVVGHLDYSFASAWHPDGRIFATGNQDKTCRVWDIRNLSMPVATLKANLGAVRSIRFSSDGQFMVVAEPADFVHVYSTQADYQKRQEIDFFGEISGVSLSPDDESLYIGIWDRTYASLLQYNKRHAYAYLDSYL
ncbi:leucine-rich repeat receptor-like protein kinase [Hibiscus syriacus]|uniref:Leucine-rich repeat receptor-like protein kinase n=1 Tax=Hibiscus syriacus TaxID=106335 RepID=A0A6A3CAY2_HIBSY|nr:leucine-rich repeat receptor-like protein kinase [Hibiscus syriacus]